MQNASICVAIREICALAGGKLLREPLINGHVIWAMALHFLAAGCR